MIPSQDNDLEGLRGINNRDPTLAYVHDCSNCTDTDNSNDKDQTNHNLIPIPTEPLMTIDQTNNLTPNDLSKPLSDFDDTDPKLILDNNKPLSILDQMDPKLIQDNTEPLTPLDQTTPTFEIEDRYETGPDIETQQWCTEIVHIGTKDDCSILVKIGERNHKTLWDSGAGKCVISYEKYKTIPEKLKTSLVPSIILIKAAIGSMIENKGECDITFKIGPAIFTFTFLVSNELTQGIILGYNFSKAFHIGTDWNKNDEMMLKMDGKYLTTTISTKQINALVQCVESIIIPARSNAMIKCRAPKAMRHQNFERICYLNLQVDTLQKMLLATLIMAQYLWMKK